MIKLLKKNKILAIIIIGFVLRIVGVLTLPNEFIFPDSEDYHQIANNILAGKGFVNIYDYKAARPPLYPFLLASFYYIGLSLIAIRILQAIISAITIWVVFLIAQEVTNRKEIHYLTALLMAIDPFIIGFSGLILTETFFIFLLTSSILCTLRILQCSVTSSSLGYSSFVAIGFAIGLATLLRTSLLPYILLFTLITSFCDKRFLYSGMIALLLIAPWTIRNKVTFDRWIPLTTKSGVNLYEALGPGATGGPRMDTMTLPEPAPQMKENERDIYLKDYTVAYLKQNPEQIFRLIPIKLWRFWNPDLNNEKLKQSPLRWIFFIYNIFLYITAIAGVYFFQRIRFYWLLLIPVLYYTAIHCVFLGSVRYRIPIMPFIFVFSAQGLFVLLAQIFPQEQIEEKALSGSC